MKIAPNNASFADSQQTHRTASFAAHLMQKARSSTDRLALEDAATKLVASALVMPALASMSQSPLRPTEGPYAVSDVEKRFGPLLHEQLADRVAKAGSFNVVESIVKRFEANIANKIEIFA